MNFLVTHVYREGNRCADALTDVWLEIPPFVRSHYAQDRLGMPNFRFVNF
jgi:hypothetical protein